MEKEEIKKLVIERFNRIEKRLEAVEKMIGNTTLTILALSEMIDNLKIPEISLVDEKAQKEASKALLALQKIIYNLKIQEIPLIDKEKKEEAIKKAGEQLGKFAARARVGPSDPISLFRKYGTMDIK